MPGISDPAKILASYLCQPAMSVIPAIERCRQAGFANFPAVSSSDNIVSIRIYCGFWRHTQDLFDRLQFMVIFGAHTGTAIRIKSTILIGLSVVLMSWGAYAQDVDLRSLECGSLDNHYGPWDYTNLEHVRERLPIVENAHFNSDVETLRAGMTGTRPGTDLDYTLRAFPNHHRALYSMARYTLQYSDRRLAPGARYTGDCYFERAIRFKPEDSTVRLIFGVYYSLQKKYAKAIEQTKTAVDLDPGNAEAHYNLGLLYERTDALEEAVQHARRAYDLGYPLDGLKNKLRRRGVWDAE